MNKDALICLDIGNSRSKLALKSAPEKLFFDAQALEFVQKNKAFLKGGQAFFTQSGEDRYQIVRELSRICSKVTPISGTLKLPFESQYDLGQIGPDRLAAVAGAQSKAPGGAFLVIDAGTCLTYDYFEPARGHLGGSIAPGLSMRFRSMALFTKALPEVQSGQELREWGYDTETALQSGVVQGVLDEINNRIGRFRKKRPDAEIYMGGGDAKFFEKRLNYPIFADFHLVMTGIAAIAEHNA